MLNMVKGLHVLDFCPLLSDSHNPVSLELHLSGNNLIDGNAVNVTKPNKRLKLWEDGKSELFWSNLSYLKIDSIVSGLSDLELRENISQNDIDCILEDMNEVFCQLPKILSVLYLIIIIRRRSLVTLHGMVHSVN